MSRVFRREISRNSNFPAADHYRGTAYEIDHPKLELEAIVSDGDATPVAQAIIHASRIKSRADAEISVCPLDQVVSIGCVHVPVRRAKRIR